MLRFAFLFLLSVATIFASTCLDCICQRESGCRNLGCRMGVISLSCGYFQIKKAYYLDCGTPGKRLGDSVETAWKRCAGDKACSMKCVKNYVAFYRHNCTGKSQCETMARLHHGGPIGCKTLATLRYWNDVKRCLGETNTTQII